MAFVDTTTDNLTDEQRNALAEKYRANMPMYGQQGFVPPADVNAHSKPQVAPKTMPTVGAAPDVDSSAAPAMPSTGGIPSLVKPTTAQSHAAGKAEYAAGMPKVGVGGFLSDQADQEEKQLQYKRLHPLGSDVSANPAVGGKIAHVLGRVGNIAADVLAPGITSAIPGSDLNNRFEEKKLQNQFSTGLINQGREEANTGAEVGNQLITDPDSGLQIQRKQWAPLGAAEIKGDTAQKVAGIRADSAEGIAAGKTKAQLLKMGYDEQGQPLPDEQLSHQQIQTRDLMGANEELQQARADYEKSKNDPNSPEFQLARQRLQQAGAAFEQRAEGLKLHQAEFEDKKTQEGFVKPSVAATGRGSAAAAALTLLPDLQEDIKKHGAEFGPIIGRLNSGELHIGDVKPEVQQLYSKLKSFYALQPAVHGFKNAEFVKDFDTIVGSLSTNPDAVVAGLEGLRPTLGAVSREGLTYHKRINEGDAGNGGGPPAGAKIHTYNPATGKME